MKILLIDTNKNFVSDIERNLIINEIRDIEIVAKTDLNDAITSLYNVNPDLIVISAGLIDDYNWLDLGISIKSFARTSEEVIKSEYASIICYGIVRKSSELLEFIKNNRTMTVEKANTYNTDQATTVLTSNMLLAQQQIATNYQAQQLGFSSVPTNTDIVHAETPKTTVDILSYANQPAETNTDINSYTSTNITENNQYYQNQQAIQNQQTYDNTQNQQIYANQYYQGYDNQYYQRQQESQAEQNQQMNYPQQYSPNNMEEMVRQMMMQMMAQMQPNMQFQQQPQQVQQPQQQIQSNQQNTTNPHVLTTPSIEQTASEQFARDMGLVKKKARCVTVYSAKGGVGKTTISCELATYLALTSHGKKNFKVCIVDFNIDFGDVLNTLSYDRNGANMTTWAANIRQRLSNGEDEACINYTNLEIEAWLQKNPKDNLYALLAPITNADSMEINEKEIQIMLRNLIENTDFDFIICDTGNNTRDSSFIPLMMSDDVLLVLEQSVNTVNCNNSFLHTIQRVDFDVSKIRLVINRVRPAKQVGIAPEELENIFTDMNTNKPFNFEIYGKIKDSTDVIEYGNNGSPLVYNVNHDFTKSIGEIVMKLLGQQSLLKKAEKKKGFFKKKG